MKNMKLAALTIALSFFSSTSYAIIDGTGAEWGNHDNQVNSSCTGLVVGGDFILTAAHCTDIQEPLTFSNSTEIETKERVNHPDYEALGLADVALFTLSEIPSVERIDFLNPRDLVTGEEVKTYGFGGTGDSLNYATLLADSAEDSAENGAPYPKVTLKNTGAGDTTNGDSGGSSFDSNGFVVTIHSGGNGDLNIATVLKVAKDFITNTVNGWHYPTVVNTVNGETKIVKIQSLYSNPVDILNTINTTGDASIDSTRITCKSPSGIVSSSSLVNPYDICTLPLTSNGDKGTIELGGNKTITVNPVEDKTPDPEVKPDSGSGGGGSLGIFGLFALAGMAFKRSKK